MLGSRTSARLVVAASLLVAVGTGLGAAPPASANDAPYATIVGSGSTDAQVLVDQWVADVDPSGINVVYTGGGASRGQHDFEQGSTDYAVVNHPEDLVAGREHAAVPLVADGLALTYRLEVDGTRITNLRLSSDAVAGIFTGAVTAWDDPRIAADNPGLDLPATPVVPVVRSDASATSGLLASWLEHEQPATWSAYTGGLDVGDAFPAPPTARESSTSRGVTDVVSGPGGDGAIGYVPYPHALEARLPVAKVLNHAGYFVAPWQYAVAIALRGATVDDEGDADLTGVFDHVDRRAYPLSSFASAVIPTASDDVRMTTAKRQSLADFLFYSLCTGQRKAGPFGYAPLPLPLVRAGFASVAKLHDADPRVAVPDSVAGCQNPTFDGADLSRDVLDEIAPYPADCDAQGAPACTDDAPPTAPAPRPAVRLAAPVRAGVHVVRRDRVYLVTAETRSNHRPRYYPPVAPGRPLRPGVPLLAAGRRGEVRVWKRWVRVQPTDRRTWRLGVRVGARATVVPVRLQR